MESKPLDVVVAGHICIDITPALDARTGLTVPDVFCPGKLTEVDAPAISSGGAVSNTGLALRRLGLEVSLMGKCGRDPFGDMLIEIIRAEAPGAEAGMRMVEGETTSYSIVLVLPGVDRIFLHCPGANHSFGPDDVDYDLVSRARVFHFGYPPLMRGMYREGGRALEAILAGARDCGALTTLDMALPDPVSESGRTDWRAVLSAVLPQTDMFLPSLEELMFMLNRERYDELSAAQGGVTEGFTLEDLRGLAGDCLRLGAGVVVIKCAHLGAYLQTQRAPGALAAVSGRAADWNDASLFVPACRVDSIQSATGAGDNAIAGFLAAVVHGLSPAKCMRTLAVVGAQNLSSITAVGGVRSWDETRAMVDGNLPAVALPPRLHPHTP